MCDGVEKGQEHDYNKYVVNGSNVLNAEQVTQQGVPRLKLLFLKAILSGMGSEEIL